MHSDCDDDDENTGKPLSDGWKSGCPS